jgi:hypothetical protein
VHAARSARVRARSLKSSPPLLGDELRITAARAALRTGPDATPAEVAQAAQAALDALSDAGPTRELGGALHGSMNAARVATLRSAPAGAIYASEVNDRNTCKPCKQVDGRWLGNTDDLAQALTALPGRRRTAVTSTVSAASAAGARSWASGGPSRPVRATQR